MEDTLQKLASVPPSGYRKQLKIQFEGEPGVDEGGVQKEFFQVKILLEFVLTWKLVLELFTFFSKNTKCFTIGNTKKFHALILGGIFFSALNRFYQN